MKRKETDTPVTTSESIPSYQVTVNSRLALPVVAIGAAAGGLEALKQFFEAMPTDAGMAFVVVLHLDPEKLSLMAEILSRSTRMTVSQANHGDIFRPDHVYVMPPGKQFSVEEGRLILTALPKDKLLASHTFDEFLRSLAAEQGDRAICIILSGTGSDGALGLKAIKAAGGMALAQEPGEAGYDGMPLAAINTGLIDYVLPVRGMPDELLHYVHHYYGDREAAAPSAELEIQVTKILDLLGQRHANDFSGYKRGTLVRRIERRMHLLHLRDITAYGERLAQDDDELAALAKDFLIVVTSFFRDPEAFALLHSQVIVPLCQQALPDNPIRVWVTGTATGEEAYSLAILILEELARCQKEACGLQVFATDVDKVGLQRARSGIFPAAIEADVSEERLTRFFDKEESCYRVKKKVRETITFSEQDLIRDTPFSRIDLISCRNLLIYLKAEAQRRILSLFHFALRPGGVLFLGNAETIGQADDLFRPLDKKWRIYRKIDTVRVPLLSFPRTQKGGASPLPSSAELKKGINLKALGERELLQHFAPCGVIVNQALDILQFLGNTNLFLTLPEGEPTVNLLAMVPAVMRTPLRAMLQDLISRKQMPASLLLRLPDHEGRPYRQIQISARRMEEGVDHELFLVAFADLPESDIIPPNLINPKESCAEHEMIIRQLEEELLQTRETLEGTIEQLETANEELKANNEEAMSMNEEFQSTNEELETSKEELQSMNEELATVNSELHDKLTELELANNDLDNLLATSDVAFLFLDEQFRIKRFTPAIQKFFRLIPSDLGRPLQDFGSIFPGSSLLDEARKVPQNLVPIEIEVQDAGGRWYLQRVLPYRTRDNHIKGVLITFLDISLLKEKEDIVRQGESSATWLSAIVESSHDAIISRAFDGTIRSWNQGAEQMFGYAAAEMIGHKIDRLFPADQPDGFEDFDLLCRGAGGGHSEPYCKTKDDRRLTVLLTQSPILGLDGEPVAVSVIMSDISARKEMERQVRDANKELENKVAERTASLQQHMAQLRRLALELTQTEQRERQRLATVLHNDLQQLLVAAGLRLERLANTEGDTGKLQAIRQVEALISRSVAATRSLATDLRPPVLNSANLVKSLHWLADWLWKRFDFSLKFSVPEDVPTDAIPAEDIVFLFDTARELCFNIVKHAHVKEGRMTLQRTAADRLRLTIVDDGVGMELKGQELPVTADGGLGLGAIRDRLALIGGELHISSAVGQGFQADIVLPYALAAASRARSIPRRRAAGKARPASGSKRTNGLAVDQKIRVMLVDDHTVVRDGLKMILLDEEDIDVIGEAGDGEKALKMADKLLPDVIVMDVNMPKMNGIEATKLIKQDHPEICIIALSINDDPGTNNAMLEAGACAYMNKSGSADDVCEVIRACLRGKSVGMPEEGGSD